ncbi:Lon protease family protein [Orenia marismortui]|uniref:endopeptidase La n=1 Tax=Orenia marismortui TaxID=46469 RepID=A0A4R8H0U1_9FIRM|nr:ATP-binding protein [Orenia marismortui]TDX51534.1 lon-related putative ATP-dependent protease [Orenia marismortui]
MEKYRLAVQDLKHRCTLGNFDFTTTVEIEPSEEIIGQEEAVKAINFGLDIDHPGYNLFIVNFSGRKELEYIRSLVNEKACQRKDSFDWCYVYNFEDPSQPRFLKLPSGLGIVFKEEMEDFINSVEEDLKELFLGEKYIKKKREIKGKYQKLSTKLFNQLKSKVKDIGYILERENNGFSIIPIQDNGDPMKEEDYKKLPKEEQEKIDQDTEMIQEMLDHLFAEIDQLNEEYNEKIIDLDYGLAAEIINYYLDGLYQKYLESNEIIDYLKEVKEDILHNLADFKEDEDGSNALLLLGGDDSVDKFNKYQVNLLVDNSKVEGAPVVIETNPTYYNLMGRVEYSNKSGELATDYTHIKAGSLHRANGGYLILEAKDILNNFKSWQLIKRVLKAGKLKMENLGEEFDKIPLAGLEAEAIPIDLKVIIMGSINLYYLLYQYDEEFKDLFKIKADFNAEMELNQGNLSRIVKYISRQCKEHSLRPLDQGAVARIIEYLCRKVDSQKKLTTKLGIITDLLCEADSWASVDNKEIISSKEIERTIKEKIKRLSHYEERLYELYESNKLLIDTRGIRVGQVNGLSVLDFGEYAFGKPVKITATVYQGNRGVINIERESKLSGKVHNKGLLILTSYLGDKYAQQVPLSLSASLCFEQLYSGVDGDSASSTELYVLLSALAELPLKQNIAVTGSINQKGEIQPIGGVNEKIEGFFKLCKSRGLTGEQGVIIPIQNVDDLMLSDDLIAAVADSKFHIYAISHVEEGMEILTAKKAGKKNKEGEYPADTINYLVQKRIEEFNNNSDSKDD